MWVPPAHSPFGPDDLLRALPAGDGAVERLEEHLRDRFDARWAVATGSGTQALQVALRMALGAVQTERRRVALPAWGCFDLATAAVDAGAPVDLYDLDPDHLAPDSESMERAVRKAGVLVAANFHGFPLDLDELRRLARRAEAVLIEDVAQGIGSIWRGRPGGTCGELTVLSFGRGKGWTGGGGGALLGRGDRFQRPGIPAARTGGRMRWGVTTAAQWLLGRPMLYGLPARMPGLGLGDTLYHEPGPIHRIRPSQAALAWLSREQALDEVDVRRSRVPVMRAVVRDRLDAIRFPDPLEGGTSAWLRLPFLMLSGADAGPRHAGTRPDLRRLGIYPGYPTPLSRLEPLQPLLDRRGSRFAGAEMLARRLWTAPLHSRIPQGALQRAPGGMREAVTGPLPEAAGP